MKFTYQNPYSVQLPFTHSVACSLIYVFNIVFAPVCAVSENKDTLRPTSIVQTRYGAVHGFTDFATDSEEVDVFFGIPFAQPPVEELRFEKPVAPHKWKGILYNRKPKSACIPVARPDDWNEEKYSEDCLYLNIFTPHQKPTDGNLLPVLFIIHGGGYVVGSAKQYSDYQEIGRKYVLQGIVVVTIQYRLSVTGFASGGDLTFPGNYGLWDQLAALKFVRENIKEFGGDPKRVTLFGFSAGGSSVSSLGLSPHSRDYFKQAVQMSGSVFSAKSANERVVNETKILGTTLGCDDLDDSVELKACLKSKTVQEIFDAVEKMGPARTDDTNFLKFGPRMDGVFFPRDFPELISESPPKPTVMGFTPMESLCFTLLPNRNSSIAAYAIPWKEFNEYGEDNFQRFVRMIASEAHFGAKDAIKVQSEIMAYYLGGGGSQLSRNSTFYLKQYTQLLTDIQYIVPIIWESRIKAAFKWPVFLYLNTYFNEKLFPDAVKVRENFHGNDHKYLFRCADPNLAHEFDTNDRAIEDFMVRWLVGFIKTGNPSTREILWPQATPEIPMRYLFIKENRPEVHDMLMFDKLKFWLTLVEKYTRYNIIRGSFHLEPPHDEL